MNLDISCNTLSFVPDIPASDSVCFRFIDLAPFIWRACVCFVFLMIWMVLLLFKIRLFAFFHMTRRVGFALFHCSIAAHFLSVTQVLQSLSVESLPHFRRNSCFVSGHTRASKKKCAGQFGSLCANSSHSEPVSHLLLSFFSLSLFLSFLFIWSHQ